MNRAKPVKLMKPYETWHVVDSNGKPVYGAERRDEPLSSIKSWLRSGERIARVEIREVQPKRRRRT